MTSLSFEITLLYTTYKHSNSVFLKRQLALHEFLAEIQQKSTHVSFTLPEQGKR
jgi:hypothetical protein